MRLKHWHATLMAATAFGCLTATAGAHLSAKGFETSVARYDLRDEVDHTFRDSKDFRHYFEHNFYSYGHEPRWEYSERSGHPEHIGRSGQMTLKDAIQNMDEDIERLRAEVRHRGYTPAARGLALEIRDHSDQVNTRIDRVGEWYRNQMDRAWRWDRSELYVRWRDLRADIDIMTRDVENRRD